MDKRYPFFREFYPFYLSEHANRACRRLHFAGTALVLGCILAAVTTGNPWWLAAAPIAGYGSAWIGHYFFEHDRPATFSYPVYSLIGDWVMFKDVSSAAFPSEPAGLPRRRPPD